MGKDVVDEFREVAASSRSPRHRCPAGRGLRHRHRASPPTAGAGRRLLAAAYPADGPGATVIVTRGGRTIYSASRGLADLAGRRPLTAETVFRLGSLTKQFTAAIVLQLVAEGRISLDDPVSRFFPDYPQPGAAATVRQLLNHTSGIQSYTGIPGFMREGEDQPPLYHRGDGRAVPRHALADPTGPGLGL